MANKIIHFHMGVDTVGEDLMIAATRKIKKHRKNEKIQLISNNEFTENFRDAISAADELMLQPAIKDLDASSNTIIFSRPGFIYAGNPLNFENSVDAAIYKIDFLQSALSDFDIFFHIFVEDHVAYLARHEKKLREISSDEISPSWTHLINSIEARLVRGNQFFIWNAERPRWLVPELCKVLTDGRLMEVPVNDIRIANHTENLRDENLLNELGWSSETLDLIFENDLEYIRSSES